jgi:hypothetical protein
MSTHAFSAFFVGLLVITAQYFTVTLNNRKGWQKQVGHNGPSDGELTAPSEPVSISD